MKLLELKYIMTSARNVAAIAKGTKSVCSSDTNLQTDFARGATITTFGQ